MDIKNMLLQLRRERDRIDQVIAALEPLAQGSKRGRGRPPSWLTLSRQSRESRTGTYGGAVKQSDANRTKQ